MSCCAHHVWPTPGGNPLSGGAGIRRRGPGQDPGLREDRKSTRLNSSHVKTSYAVFCLKKKIRRGSRQTRDGRGDGRALDMLRYWQLRVLDHADWRVK